MSHIFEYALVDVQGNMTTQLPYCEPAGENLIIYKALCIWEQVSRLNKWD